MKAEVAEAAIPAGAAIVNDIRGLQGDAGDGGRRGAHTAPASSPCTIPASSAPRRRLPATRSRPASPISSARLRSPRAPASADDRIVLDPGFGFGKSPEQNLELLAPPPGACRARLSDPRRHVAKILHRQGHRPRQARTAWSGTLVTNVVAALAGAAIVRVHDVAEHVEAMRMAAAIRGRRPQAVTRRMTSAVLGLGGNIGDSRKLIAAAIDALAANPEITVEAVSALYLTPPWGKIDQPAFLNAAARIETTLSPRALLEAVLDVERQLGRERLERWGPRRIDIDILLFGTVEMDEPGLHIPHPRLTERAFALVPLVDVMPDAVVDGRGGQGVGRRERQQPACSGSPGRAGTTELDGRAAGRLSSSYFR